MTNIYLLHVSTPGCHPQGVLQILWPERFPEDGTPVPKHVDLSQTVLSAPVGWCINYYSMQCMKNINVRCEVTVNLLSQLQQCTVWHVILGALAKLRKATISLVIMSVYPSVRLSAWNNSTPTGRIFHKFHIWSSSAILWKNSSFIRIWQE